MINSYRLVVDHALSSLFRDAFNVVVEREGFDSILKLAAPGTGVWEFQRGEVIVSLHTSSAEQDKEELVIQSETSDLTGLIAAPDQEFIGQGAANIAAGLF
ncbi:MAG: hypothetical protein ACE5JL_13610, partial [Dehalococcoidia bacterium]